jgi:hypothetical protein
MIFFLQLWRWAIHWQLGGYDPERDQHVIARLELKQNYRPRYGWRVLWIQKPDWNHFPTTAALRIERTKNGETALYTFRGPIERTIVPTL